MASAGMDRRTGRLLRDFAHVVQSIEDILTTDIAERITREWYGFPGFKMLGELLNEPNLLRFFQLVAVALTMRQLNGLPAEPRFRIVKLSLLEATRAGEITCRIEGEYLPRGHLGDFTPAGARSVILTNADGRFTASEGL